MSMFRVYIFDAETGKELASPFNGKAWLGCSGYVNMEAGTASSIEIADFANLHTVKGRRAITAKDFDRKVKVKIWYGPGNAEWRRLV